MGLWSSAESVIDGMYRRVCPLYSFDDRRRVYLKGSAIPFDSGGFRFLLTAAHVCRATDGQPVPLFTYGNERPWALTERRGWWDYEPGRSPDADIAVITLTTDCADDLAGYYQFSVPSDVSSIERVTEFTRFIVAGYPAVRNRCKVFSRGLPSAVTSVVSDSLVDLSQLRTEDKTDELHFALDIPPRPLRALDGRLFRLQKFGGMSGSGIWRVEIDPRARLISTPSLVGLGIEHHRKPAAIIATRLRVAVPLVRDLLDLSERQSTDADGGED